MTAGIATAGLLGATRDPMAEPAAPTTRIPRASLGYFTSNGGMFIPRAQGFDATNAEFYEAPLEDPDHLEIWCYTDKLSYSPGEVVEFHTSTTGTEFSLEVIRDGHRPKSVHRMERLTGRMHRTPSDFYEKGCDWPVSYRWKLPEDLPSGFYMVISRTSSPRKSLVTGKPEVREQEHGFFVRRHPDRPPADILFIASTSTWTAYNDWGGFSHYEGYDLPNGFRFAPRLSIHRPFARGIVWTPEGAPRKPHHFPIVPNSIPIYPVIDFAFSRGFSKWYANCGWATYERNFASFAERESFAIDYATQIDLHYDQHLLDGYKCVVMVGHCEYWTWEMREAIERFAERGGNVARFAGNFGWQIRLEEAGRVQVAYRGRAREFDPIRNTDQRRRITANWDDPLVDWFGAETFGLNTASGIYAHVGLNVPRGPGGFTVYRPDHWVFEGTDLYYGDILGGEARIFGYEVDGLDYTFKDGIPLPTFRDRARPGTEILALGLAANQEVDHGHKGAVFYYGDEAAATARQRYGVVNEETVKAGARANGMIVVFPKGRGTMFHAGSCEWVAGLKLRDYATEAVTRNVLNRFIGRS